MTILEKPKPERKPAPIPAGIPGNWVHVGATAKAVLEGLEEELCEVFSGLLGERP